MRMYNSYLLILILKKKGKGQPGTYAHAATCMARKKRPLLEEDNALFVLAAWPVVWTIMHSLVTYT